MDSENSIDELISDVIQRIEDYQPKTERHPPEQPRFMKSQKPNLKKTNIYSTIMKGLEPQGENQNKNLENLTSEQKSELSMRKFEFGAPELLEDPALKQDWRQKNLMRDLIDEIDDKISQR